MSLIPIFGLTIPGSPTDFLCVQNKLWLVTTSLIGWFYCCFSLNFGHQSVSSVAQLCPTLRYPVNHSTPGLPVHHQLPEFIQTHAHRVGDATQPSHPLSSPSPPAPNHLLPNSCLKMEPSTPTSNYRGLHCIRSIFLWVKHSTPRPYKWQASLCCLRYLWQWNWKPLNRMDSLWPRGLYSPLTSPDQNTGVGSRSLLQGIFPTQGSNPGLLNCKQFL